MGITVKYDRKNPLDELRRVSGADKRPPAVLVTFDFDTNDYRDSPYRNDLVSYLEGTLGGVMVTQSSYAIPYNNAVIDIIAKIGQITHDSITAYAFPLQNWYGHGNAIADEWFQKHELPSLPLTVAIKKRVPSQIVRNPNEEPPCGHKLVGFRWRFSKVRLQLALAGLLFARFNLLGFFIGIHAVGMTSRGDSFSWTRIHGFFSEFLAIGALSYHSLT